MKKICLVLVLLFIFSCSLIEPIEIKSKYKDSSIDSYVEKIVNNQSNEKIIYDNMLKIYNETQLENLKYDIVKMSRFANEKVPFNDLDKDSLYFSYAPDSIKKDIYFQTIADFLYKIEYYKEAKSIYTKDIIYKMEKAPKSVNNLISIYAKEKNYYAVQYLSLLLQKNVSAYEFKKLAKRTKEILPNKNEEHFENISYIPPVPLIDTFSVEIFVELLDKFSKEQAKEYYLLNDKITEEEIFTSGLKFFGYDVDFGYSKTFGNIFYIFHTKDKTTSTYLIYSILDYYEKLNNKKYGRFPLRYN